MEVTGRRRHCKQLCGGMEIPCKLVFTCSSKNRAGFRLLPCHYTMKEGEWGPFFPKLRVRIKDNNSSPHGKFHRFLFPFSCKFPDLNFASYVLYIYLCGTHSEPGLPVQQHTLSFFHVSLLRS